MKILSVYYHGNIKLGPVLVGRLAYDQGLSKFEYDPIFLKSGLNLSPFSLEPHALLQSPTPQPFQGLHGLFNDSLPDGWGLYLMDKIFKKNGFPIEEVTPLDRLAYMGDRALGALSYQPDEGVQFQLKADAQLELNRLAEESIKLYTGELEQVLNELAVNGTPSGGARPKVLIGMDGSHTISGAYDLPDGYTHWLAKFPMGTKAEDKSEGAIEFIYSNMARTAGIDFPDTKLTPGEDNNAYFLTKRFDRGDKNRRIHMHTLAGLVNADFRVADFSYEKLIKVCMTLTRSHQETTQLFRRMLFNILCGNRDDHTKNFSFLMDENGIWKNSPAYDVVFNRGIAGEHTMDIMGKGKQITLQDIEPLAKVASLKMIDVKRMISEISESLSTWEKAASHLNIPNSQISEISKHIILQRKLLT